MSHKIKIFGIQTNIEWYDIKTIFKKLLRKITYSWFFQQSLCLLISSYIHIVYFTSKKKFINQKIFVDALNRKDALIIAFWHNRLMMTPFISLKFKKLYPNHRLMALASKHGDGRFVGKVMERFDMISIFGSTRNKRNPSRGIDFSSMRQIIDGLKSGYSLGITPDGPRGPNKKINGEIINIARLSNAKILPISCHSSRALQLKTWDEFKIPLPFSCLSFYFDDPIEIAQDVEGREEELKLLVESRLNFAENEVSKIAN